MIESTADWHLIPQTGIDFWGWKPAPRAGAQDENVTKDVRTSYKLKNVFVLYLSEMLKELGKLRHFTVLLHFLKMCAEQHE